MKIPGIIAVMILIAGCSSSRHVATETGSAITMETSATAFAEDHSESSTGIKRIEGCDSLFILIKADSIVTPAGVIHRPTINIGATSPIRKTESEHTESTTAEQTTARQTVVEARDSTSATAATSATAVCTPPAISGELIRAVGLMIPVVLTVLALRRFKK